MPASALTPREHLRNQNRITCRGCSRTTAANIRPFVFNGCTTAYHSQHAMRGKGAEGPDEISPTFPKALSPMAKAELLSIFNESFSKGVMPGIWKEVTILPLKKAGKPPGAISSYLPVRLTSCVIKTMERMVNNHLCNLAEADSSESRKPSVTASRPPSHNAAPTCGIT